MIAKSMLAACAATAFLACAAEAADPEPAKLRADVVRGKYLVQVAGCNDCHTPGYLETAGDEILVRSAIDLKDLIMAHPESARVILERLHYMYRRSLEDPN